MSAVGVALVARVGRKDRIIYEGRIDRFIDEEKKVAYRLEKKEEREMFMEKMSEIFSFFSKQYGGCLSMQTCERIFQMFTIPTAPICVITRLGNELEKRGIDKKAWMTEAMEIFVEHTPMVNEGAD